MKEGNKMKKYLLKVLTICVLSLSIISTSTQTTLAATNSDYSTHSITHNSDGSYDIEVVYPNVFENGLLTTQYSYKIWQF